MSQTTIFEVMSGLCREFDAINLGQGFPDMEEPPEIIGAAQRALAERSNQYPPMRGLPELRGAVAGLYGVSAAEVIVTSGATEALASAILALVRPGDEVICIQPLYDAYLPLVARAGGVARLVNLRPPAWSLDLAELAGAITDKTRLIILNTPNNPTGTVLDRATLEGIGALAQRHGLYVLSDEVWEATLLDGSKPLSVLDIPSLRDRSVKVGSAGKIFSLTGWKIGWAVAAPELAERVAASHQFITFTTPTPLQWAVAEGLALGEAWFAAHRARYVESKARLVVGLTQAGFCVLPGAGTWFVTVDLEASGLPAQDEALAQRLVREAGVGSIPVSAFYADRPERGYLRLCHAKRGETLDQAVERLARFRAGFV
ncbi:aminotransferase class I/II-fold pyridoxal phosphate-dependent enzyme [Novosphingobium sp. KACC 22771]|uniref:aminotransferase class I/II-fold pyridoxal phosphate-dependent enzyme n=1 Tax=Novosphingobium sp. KACC 22771 TaxID=3025670 RepID=UPI0023662E08|nr:aminotransferase class I/II-fold pyridoxal phosphate-dependent enzyme [Novosphingobium sp. KACC 22771]WDF71146.1 aminotransferase class I/II-fold pyridoxal phosphate-dependent enzyme [Novosphingobium sp. KACC 22771]